MAVDAGDSMTMTAEVLMTDAADAAVEAEAPMTGAADAAVAPMTGGGGCGRDSNDGRGCDGRNSWCGCGNNQNDRERRAFREVPGRLAPRLLAGLSRCLLGPGFQRRRVLRRLNFCKADKTDNDA